MKAIMRRAERSALAGAVTGIVVWAAILGSRPAGSRLPAPGALFHMWLGTAVTTAVAVFVVWHVPAAWAAVRRRQQERQMRAGDWQ